MMATHITEKDLQIPVFLFKEDNFHFAYLPALELNGYGYTAQEASESLKVMLELFLDYTIKEDTLLSELHRLGWKVKQYEMTPPDISYLIEKDEILKDIIDHKNYVNTFYPVHFPQPA